MYVGAVTAAIVSTTPAAASVTGEELKVSVGQQTSS
jgi:hypothetical protein